MNHLGTKTIETERLILRPLTLDDIYAAFSNWTSDGKVAEFLRWESHKDINVTKSVFDIWVKSYKEKDFYQWGIVLKSINEPIGTISLVDIKENLGIAHIGYCIGSRWWHQGITTEAFKAIIPFLFNEVGFNRIESMHDPNNPHSGSVMKKCGLKYEGTLRSADFSNKGIVDASIYGLLKEEWENGE
ncbi:MAG: GNAT family N-acetyltransferase [Acholeplasmatales bacterium]|nr:GNAT family N-acetyltransferase [Acholeplasmatales bacterium]